MRVTAMLLLLAAFSAGQYLETTIPFTPGTEPGEPASIVWNSVNDRRGTLPQFSVDAKARRGELTADSLQLTASVGYGIRNTPERLAVSRKPIADSVETMVTADSLQLTAYGPEKNRIRFVEGTADRLRLTACGRTWVRGS
jgi:hypothetical protein